MAPLSEVRNQAGPARRPAVYGRKRAVHADSRELHRQLFGTDENNVFKHFEKLSIKSEPTAQSALAASSPSQPGKKSLQIQSQSETAPTSLKSDQVSAASDYEQKDLWKQETNLETSKLSKADQQIPAKAELIPKILTKPDSRQEDPANSESRKKPSASSKFRRKSDLVAESTSVMLANVESTQRTSAKPASKEKILPKTRRQPVRGRRRDMAPITFKESELLQPLLSSTYVHSNVKSFRQYVDEIRPKCTIKKLGEGTFSNAFLLTEKENNDTSVIKIIPFQLKPGRGRGGGSKHSQGSTCSVDDLLREIKVLDALTNLPGFARARGKHQILRGKFHEDLVEVFEQFRLDHPEQATNESPSTHDNDASFYGVIEMSFAGTELDLGLTSVDCFAAFDIFWMATIFLATGERVLKFEHRDLHMSNFCFTRPATVYSPEEGVALGRSGLEVTIIDYTLSRMQLGEETLWDSRGVGAGSVEEPSKHERDASQRTAICRARRWCQRVASQRAEGTPSDDWQTYLPKTTVIWLGHLLTELQRKKIEVEKTATEEEAAEQRRVWEGLTAVQGALDCAELDELPESAESLLEKGFEEGWIAKGDVVAFKEYLNRENA